MHTGQKRQGQRSARWGVVVLASATLLPSLASSISLPGLTWLQASPAQAQGRAPYDEDDDPPPEARDSGDVDLDTFYRELRPYGTWWDHPRYGRVWTPRGVDRDWKPYTRGHWARTEDHGWFWVAEEEWGWAPFHYGRWGYDEDEGWFWVPGTQWGPAWVVWRENEDVVGWAPLPPDAEWDRVEGLRFNSNDYNGTRWSYAWSFVDPRYMFLPGLYTRLIPRQQHATYLRNSRPIWSYTYRDQRVVNGGLDWRRIERRTGQPVPTVRLNFVDNHRRGGWRSIQDPRTVPVYRPRVAVQPGGPRPDLRRNDGPGWGWRPPTPPDPRPPRDVVRPQGGFWGGRGPEPTRVDPPVRGDPRRDPGRDWRPGDGSPRGGTVSPPPNPRYDPAPNPRGEPVTVPRGGTVDPTGRPVFDRGSPRGGGPVTQPTPQTQPPLQPPTPRPTPQTQPPTPPPITRQSPPPQQPATQPPRDAGPRGTGPSPGPGSGGPRGEPPRGGDAPRGGDRPRGDGQRGDRPPRDPNQPQPRQ